MALSGILKLAATATTNPNPNSLGTKTPYPTPYVNAHFVSAAWQAQAIGASGCNAIFPTQSSNGQGMVPIPVHFVSAVGFTASIWQYNKLSNTWFPHATNPSIVYTGETGNLLVNVYTNIPMFIQLSTGPVDIYFDNGLASIGSIYS